MENIVHNSPPFAAAVPPLAEWRRLGRIEAGCRWQYLPGSELVPLKNEAPAAPAARHAGAPHGGPHDHDPPAPQPAQPDDRLAIASATGIPPERIAFLQLLGDSVGRIEVSYRDEGFQIVGTAWLVRRDLAVTSRHVALNLHSGFTLGVGEEPALRTSVFGDEPKVEIQLGNGRLLRVASVAWVETLDDERSPDLAFLRLAEDAGASPLTLGALRENQEIAVIQYPVVADPTGHRHLERPGEEHISAGQVVAFDTHLLTLDHTASTFGGSSGSPVVDWRELRVVGMHSGANITLTNRAVLASAIAERLAQLDL